MINDYIKTTLEGKNDSDRHLMVLFSLALATRGKNFIELGVRSGTSTSPLKLAAELNKGKLHSVDIDVNPFKNKKDNHWEFYQSDAVQFLEKWEKENKPSPDLVYVDDWHSYDHVKKELDILDRIVTPSTIILLHDTMYGNTCPYYHTDLSLKDGQWANGGPYRAVAELNVQFWEFSTLPWSHGLTILRKKYSNRNTR
jgi:predicted O-methyltransferase YrrM